MSDTWRTRIGAEPAGRTGTRTCRTANALASTSPQANPPARTPTAPIPSAPIPTGPIPTAPISTAPTPAAPNPPAPSAAEPRVVTRPGPRLRRGGRRRRRVGVRAAARVTPARGRAPSGTRRRWPRGAPPVGRGDARVPAGGPVRPPVGQRRAREGNLHRRARTGIGTRRRPLRD